VIGWVNAAVPLPELIAELRPGLALRRVGRGYGGYCPWHDDAAPDEVGRPGSPSLYLVEDWQLGWGWKCFSSACGAHTGSLRDTFDWLVWEAGGDQRSAIIWALERYGLRRDELRPPAHAPEAHPQPPHRGKPTRRAAQG
jgi:hypothetical protein